MHIPIPEHVNRALQKAFLLVPSYWGNLLAFSFYKSQKHISVCLQFHWISALHLSSEKLKC